MTNGTTLNSKKNTTFELIEGLLEDHEIYTYYHSIEVGVMSWVMGSLLGLDPEKCFQLGLLHDIGKLGIDSSILSLRFLLNLDKIWNDDHTEQVPFQYRLNDDERNILHKHGVFGKMILKHLGFDSLFQQVAEDHGKNTLAFRDDEPLELMIVTLADWFSAIKDTYRNKSRGTDWNSIEKAKEKMENLFSEPSTNLPEEVKQAFWDMINIFNIYPPEGKENGEIFYWYRLFNPFYKDLTTEDRKKPLRSEELIQQVKVFYLTLPDLGDIKRKMQP